MIEAKLAFRQFRMAAAHAICGHGTCLAKVGSCATVVTILDWMASVPWQFFWSSASTPRLGRSSTASSV